jgi:hypothetical protein
MNKNKNKKNKNKKKKQEQEQDEREQKEQEQEKQEHVQEQESHSPRHSYAFWLRCTCKTFGLLSLLFCPLRHGCLSVCLSALKKYSQLNCMNKLRF